MQGQSSRVIMDIYVKKLAAMKPRSLLTQAFAFGMIVASALILWKSLMLITGSESPIVVVLSG